MGRMERYSKRELIEAIIRNREQGISERTTLRDMGYANTSVKYQQLKEWAMQTDTELYMQLSNDEQDGIRKKREAAELAEFLGEKASELKEEVKAPVETKPVEEPVEKPVEEPAEEEDTGLSIIGIRGRAGEWRIENGFIRLTDTKQHIASLPVDVWEKAVRDLPGVLKIFAFEGK